MSIAYLGLLLLPPRVRLRERSSVGGLRVAQPTAHHAALLDRLHNCAQFVIQESGPVR